jgi:anti-anti-sigma regulatory factor
MVNCDFLSVIDSMAVAHLLFVIESSRERGGKSTKEQAGEETKQIGRIQRPLKVTEGQDV